MPILLEVLHLELSLRAVRLCVLELVDLFLQEQVGLFLQAAELCPLEGAESLEAMEFLRQRPAWKTGLSCLHLHYLESLAGSCWCQSSLQPTCIYAHYYILSHTHTDMHTH